MSESKQSIISTSYRQDLFGIAPLSTYAYKKVIWLKPIYTEGRRKVKLWCQRYIGVKQDNTVEYGSASAREHTTQKVGWVRWYGPFNGYPAARVGTLEEQSSLQETLRIVSKQWRRKISLGYKQTDDDT